MGRGPRLPFVEITEGAELYRQLRNDRLVEAKKYRGRLPGMIRVRRVGVKTWSTWRRNVFNREHEPVEVR